MAQKERNDAVKRLPVAFGYICSSVLVKLLLANITLKERDHQINKFSLTNYKQVYLRTMQDL